MSSSLIIFLYCIVAYGFSNMFVFGSGPFRVFEHIRNLADDINEHTGLLFRCMMCFPANFGLFVSLINWFFISVPFTPFNILLDNTNLWWLAAVLDCGFTSGIVWLINTVQEFFENIGEKESEPLPEEENDDIIEADDITLKNK